MQTATSKDFNRHAGALRQRASLSPLLITDRGRPAHVLMSYEAWKTLQTASRTLDPFAAAGLPEHSVANLLGMSVSDDLDSVLQPSRELGMAANLS